MPPSLVLVACMHGAQENIGSGVWLLWPAGHLSASYLHLLVLFALARDGPNEGEDGL